MKKKYLEDKIGKMITFFYDNNGKLSIQKGQLVSLDDDVAYFLTRQNVFVAELGFIKMFKIAKGDLNTMSDL